MFITLYASIDHHVMLHTCFQMNGERYLCQQPINKSALLYSRFILKPDRINTALLPVGLFIKKLSHSSLSKTNEKGVAVEK